jgi:hypothetical protein
MPGINVHQLEGQLRGPEGFLREVRHYDGVFSAGKEQDWFFKLRGCLTKDKNRFGL